MTDYMTIHPLKRRFNGAFLTKVVYSALLASSVLVQPASAQQQDWWFDVEVILFARNLDVTDISEKFEQSRLVHDESEYLDLLTPYLHPDLSYLRAGLNYCRTSSKQAVKNQNQQDFAFPKPVVDENVPQSVQAYENTVEQIASTVQSLSDAIDGFDATEGTDSTDANDSTDIEESKNLNSENVNTENSAQQQDLALTAQEHVVRPPIKVEFIEWQIPSELPCAYFEQVDPSFASIDYLKEAQLNNQDGGLITRVPVVIDGIEWPQKHSAMLLPKSTMFMHDLYEKIRKQRDITPILHLNWRQETHFGRENGQTIRLFAGQNYAEQFDAQGLPVLPDSDELIDSLIQQEDAFYIPEEERALLSLEQQHALLTDVNDSEVVITEDLFTKIDKALLDDTPINFEHTDVNTKQAINNTDSTHLKELWQLDGGITVYLRKVGRVPYLHIDSNFDYRQPIYDPKKAPKTPALPNSASLQGAIAVNQFKQPNYLQSVNFDQLRRVISKQVHYFDHPLFGMVVRIQRYRWPEEPTESVESDTPDN